MSRMDIVQLYLIFFFITKKKITENKKGRKNNCFSGGITKHAPRSLDPMSLDTREREFRGRFLKIRTHQSNMFWKPVRLRSWETRLVDHKLQVSEACLIGAL